MLYASTSRALACLETLVHLGAGDLPLNRYLVEIRLPWQDWKGRVVFEPRRHAAWDAEPAGATSIEWGTGWARSGKTLLAQVPSAIVAEEFNVLINPRHAGMGDVRSNTVRRWGYDLRLREDRRA